MKRGNFLLNEVIAFRPAFARAFRSPTTGLFLSQCIYWQNIAGIGKWWFKLRDAKKDLHGNMLPPSNKSEQSWEWELGMTRSQQETARKDLEIAGLLHCKRKGVPAKLYFLLDMERLTEFVKQYEAKLVSNKCDLPIVTMTPDILAVSRQRDGDFAPTTSEINQTFTKSRSSKERTQHTNDVRTYPIYKGTTKNYVRSHGGIFCWNKSDHKLATSFEDRFGLEIVRNAVDKLLQDNIAPLPSRVSKLILDESFVSKKKLAIKKEIEAQAIGENACRAREVLINSSACVLTGTRT